jgi:hypothetical protein
MTAAEHGTSQGKPSDSSADRDDKKSLKQSDRVGRLGKVSGERDRSPAATRNEASGRVGSSTSSEARR